MLNLRAAVRRGESSVKAVVIFGFLISATTVMGCASGRSLSKSELSEFESLANEKTQLEIQTRDARRKQRRAFSRVPGYPNTEHALLCGGDSRTLSTGKVPLVYAKPKRVIFKPNRKQNPNGCAQLVIEVKP